MTQNRREEEENEKNSLNKFSWLFSCYKRQKYIYVKFPLAEKFFNYTKKAEKIYL